MKLKLFITAIVAVAAFSPGHAGSKAKNDCNITINDVWTAYDAFNNVYLDTDKNIYKNTDRDKAAIGRDRGAAAIWCQPMYVDMAINAVELAKKSGDKKREEKYSTLLNNLLEGNIAHYLNFDFDDADLNRGWFIYDDIQWWTITMARAYLATGNEKYRRLRRKSVCPACGTAHHASAIQAHMPTRQKGLAGECSGNGSLSTKPVQTRPDTAKCRV